MKSKIAPEVKSEVLSKVKGGEAVATLAQSYGISVKTIYGWLRWETTNKISWKEYSKLKKENQTLKEIVEVLTPELQKVKKRQLIEIVQIKVKSATKPLISRLFGLTRKSLYLKSEKETQDELLKTQILDCLAVNPSYGHRRLALALGVGKKRVRRVMRLYGIKTFKRKARWTKKRDKSKPDSGYSNLIRGSCPIVPKVVYAGDFTRPVWNGKRYLLSHIYKFIYQRNSWLVNFHQAHL